VNSFGGGTVLTLRPRLHRFGRAGAFSFLQSARRDGRNENARLCCPVSIGVKVAQFQARDRDHGPILAAGQAGGRRDSMLKLDGFRVLAVIESGRVQLIRVTGISSLYSPVLKADRGGDAGRKQYSAR
jgi:hypothetical protein